MLEKGKLQARLLAFFNIEEDEGLPVLFLFIHSLFLGAVVAFYYVASTALFLDSIPNREWIAYAYIVSGALAYAISGLYRLLEKRTSFSNRLVLILAFLLVTVGFFSIAAQVEGPSRALYFVVFIWFNLMLYLTSVAFWGMAGRFFNLRQGKRLFGLISTGNVVSGLVGYISIPFLRTILEVHHLLFICAGIYAFWLLFMVVTVRRFSEVLAVKRAKKGKVLDPEEKEMGFFANRYTTLVFLLALLPVFCLFFVDFLFLDMAKTEFKDIKVFATFISVFTGIIKVIELTLKYLSGRLMSRYGIKLGLAALPVLLVLSVGLATVSGFVFPDDKTALFGFIIPAIFGFIILSKLFDRTARTAINDPAFQVLFQPIPANQRFVFQAKIEGVPKQLGLLLVGVTLIALGATEAITDAQKSLLLFVVLIGWLVVVRMMYQAYRGSLRQTLERAREQSTRSLQSAATIELLKEKLKDLHHDKITPSLRLLGNLEPASIDAFLINLLEYSEPDIRRAALEELGRLRPPTALPAVDLLLTTEADARLRALAQQVRQGLVALQQRSTSLESMTKMAHSADPTDRRYGALLLGQTTDPKVQELLIDLLQDPVRVVRKTAIVAAGKNQSPAFWPLIIEHLAKPLYSSAAASVLVELGEPVLPSLERSFNKMIDRPKILRRILNIYGRIGGEKASRLLWDQINFPDASVADQTLKALNLCGYQANEEQWVVIRQKIYETVDAVAWSMAAIRDLGKDEDVAPLRTALEKGIERNRDRLFLLFSLRYDADAMDLVRNRFREESDQGRIYALELMDLLFTQEAKNLVFPVLEGRLKRLEKNFSQLRQQRLSRLERIKEIINRDYTKVDRWTKACALHTLSTLYDQKLHDELFANVFNPHPMLRETATLGIHHIDPEAFHREISKLGQQAKRTLEQLSKQADPSGSTEPRLVKISDKVNFLKQVKVLSKLPEGQLAALIPSLEEVALKDGDTFIEEGDTANELYIVISGEVRVDIGNKSVARLGPTTIIGEMAVLNEDSRTASVTAMGDTRLFCLKGEHFFELVFDHVELIGELILLLTKRQLPPEPMRSMELRFA